MPERMSQAPEREYHKDTCKREAGYFFVAHPVLNCCHKAFGKLYLKLILMIEQAGVA
jgi:hypothetical protein